MQSIVSHASRQGVGLWKEIVGVGDWICATISAQILQSTTPQRSAAQATASPTFLPMTRKISMASERNATVTKGEVEYLNINVIV